ncbi:hypothetical protein [Christensenella tenuis]|uniref:Uncharacterized protein n=1 Tax=Christensenella tenuis TaxID=2763033 RepID=A0ABR7EHC8_9FIRM|nr:hypothetical protein [Christensenella tenuis]MBC5648568.1 hypothetical protein [Christensenella tenuis]
MKKIVLVVAAVVLCMAFAVGCAAPAAAPSESAPASEAASAEASGEASAAANTDYMSWTATEWEAASDAEKTAASEALLLDIGDYLMDGFAAMVEQAKTDDSVKEQIDSQVESLKTQIETFLASSSSFTIGDLAQASKQAVGSAE